jgi:hypothetical protein
MFDKSIAAKPPTVDYKSIMESDGIAEWTRQIVCMSASANLSVADLKERIWFVICQGLPDRSRGDTKAVGEDWTNPRNSLW